MIRIHTIRDNFKPHLSKVGCEGCGKVVGFRTRRLWVEFNFLHGKCAV